MIYFDEYASVVGLLTLASDGENLCGLWLEGQKHFRELYLDVDRKCINGESARPQALQKARAWLDAYFKGHDPGSLPPVTFYGTHFQKRVWEELLRIPYGTLTTYGAIAQALSEKYGKRQSARAVGAAVGRNPISIIVPCHRVIGASGSLTGYAGGISRKIKLLELEGVDTAKLKSPPAKGVAL